MSTDKLASEIVVEAVKFCAFLHRWTPRQIEDHPTGVEEHMDRIRACNAVWITTSMLMKIDNRMDWIDPVLVSYNTWTDTLTSMYEYLGQSPEPFPGSFVTMGMKLTPGRRDKEDDSVEYLKRLQTKVETLMLKSAMHEQQAELLNVRTRLDLLMKAHVNSPAEDEVVKGEIAKLMGQLRRSEGRDEFQDRYMTNLQQFKDLVGEAIVLAEKLVSEAETKS